MVKNFVFFSLLSLVLILPACKKATNESTLSNKNVTLSNATDAFSFSGNDFVKESGHVDYTWKCTKTNVQVSSSVLKTGGDGTVIIKDPSGTSVLNKKISEMPASSVFTNVMAGDWEIQITFNSYDGKQTLTLQGY